jgi:hypothetical protein
MPADAFLANDNWRCLASAVYTIGTLGRQQREDASPWSGGLRHRLIIGQPVSSNRMFAVGVQAKSQRRVISAE